MKVGDIVTYTGKSTDFITKNKDYEIIAVEEDCFNILSNYNREYVVNIGRKEFQLKEDFIKLNKSREFSTGAKRDSNENKIRPDLISPYMLKALGKVLADGAKYYGDRNWEKGMPQEVFKESASRHYVSWMNNENDEDHAAKLIFNIMAWIHFRDKNQTK